MKVIVAFPGLYLRWVDIFIQITSDLYFNICYYRSHSTCQICSKDDVEDEIGIYLGSVGSEINVLTMERT